MSTADRNDVAGELNNTLHKGNEVVNRSQKHDEVLNFATDAWTSPNHRAYVAVTVHFEKQGTLVSMLLDLVQVATSHSGVNLAAVFAKVLDNFGISNKVLDSPITRELSILTCIQILSIACNNASNNNTMELLSLEPPSCLKTINLHTLPPSHKLPESSAH